MTGSVQHAKTGQAAFSEERIVSIDVLQVVHEPEWSIGQDSAITLQVIDSILTEAPDFIHAGLGTTVEVLHVHVCG